MLSTKNSPKRALLIRNAASYDFGGAERFVVALAGELRKNNWQATVVTAHRGVAQHAAEKQIPIVHGWWWSRQDWSGKKVLLTPVYVGWQILLTLWYMQLIVRLRPDVVHPQSKDDFIAATIAARMLGKRVIWTDHADLKYILQNVRMPLKNPVGKLVRFCSRFAHGITLVSQSEGRLISEQLRNPLPTNYTVIYNGITNFVPEAVERNKSDKNALVFCATSRLVTAKGIGELIDAFRLIATPEMRLWLLGEGPEEAKFKAQAGDDRRIVFMGFPANSWSILKSADIFVHPSYHEGFSLSLIEAAMLAKPIIACNVGGNPEIIQDGVNGLLIEEKKLQSLADAMKRLANDKKLRDSLSKAARRTYEDRFRFDKIVKEEFLPLYEK